MDAFVTGTDTGVGKTVLAALMAAALGNGYWKPIQTGRIQGRAPTDRETVIAWTGLDAPNAPPEAYVFDPPVSPHLAALEAGVTIDLPSIRRPRTPLPLVIEGAGGVMVPINETEFMLDLMHHLAVPIVVAARTQPGTINHTLLTVEAIRRRKLALTGVVLVGEQNEENRKAIERYGGVRVIGWIPPMSRIDRAALVAVFERHFDRSCFDGKSAYES